MLTTRTYNNYYVSYKVKVAVLVSLKNTYVIIVLQE